MQNTNFEFETEIQASEIGKGGAFVVFPQDIRALFHKGRVKVSATFDGAPYRGSIVNMGVKHPDGTIAYILGMPKAIRTAIDKNVGDTVTVHVTVLLED